MALKRSLSWFLARRFYNNVGVDRQRKASRMAVHIAASGVALGLAVMIVSLCVVRGFQQEISNKLVGFVSHLTVMNDSTYITFGDHPIVADRQWVDKVAALPGVRHVQRVSQKVGVLKTNEAYQTMVLKGIGSDYDSRFLAGHVVEGQFPDFASDSAANSIVISRMMADKLGLRLGDRVYSYFFEETIKMRRFRIVAVYETSLPQFDDVYVLASLHTVNRLNNWKTDECSVLEIRVDDYDNLDHTQIAVGSLINGITDRNGATYMSESVKENPQTGAAISWLEVLNMNVWVILALMTGVAGFTMISGLLILILERTRTIGVLKAMGATNDRIRHTFLLYAAQIVVRGLFWGNVLGIGLVAVQKYFGVVRLDPASYYVSVAPVALEAGWLVALNLATLLITVFALVVPSFVVSRIQPAKAIQFD